MSVGAIVMNCNPFTLGHRYLVEYAAAQVVKLYIFVVEEDKSEFPFADRFELVKQGVRDIANVEVIPSGKFIISQQTFSGYFNKAQLQDVAVDSSEDVEIFATEIAPTLGITIRFAGEEPTDNVTRQYNDTMKNILPRYGLEFREIPRKTSGDEIISASTVRAALKIGDFDKIKRLVPETTYLYLRERHSNASTVSAALNSGDFNQAEGRVPETTGANLREQYEEFLRRRTARVDVKFWSTEGDFKVVSVSDNNATVLKPGWFQKDGVGYQIESRAKKLAVVVKATVDGRIEFKFRGIDVRTPNDRTKRIPYWIDYTRLTINGETIFNELMPAWYAKIYRHKMNVTADEEITIQIEWLPHNE